MPPDTHHYQHLAAKVATMAAETFDRYQKDEIARAGWLQKAEVRIGYDVVRPRIPALAQELLDTVYNDFASLTLNDLLQALDHYRAAQGTSPP